MQYCLLRLLASHKRITIVGDEDQVDFQSCYSFILILIYIDMPLPTVLV